MRKTSYFWILPLIIAVMVLGCPDPVTPSDTRKVLAAGSAVTAAAGETSKSVTFTGASGLALAASDFSVDNDASISAVSITGDIATVMVSIGANSGTAPIVYTVSIAASSKKIKGDAKVTITQAGVLVDTRVELTSGGPVDSAAADTGATVTFTGATGITSLTAADFTFGAGLTAGTITISSGTVTIAVTFAANTGSTEKTYTVGIASGSTKIKGSASVTITQAFPGDTRVTLTAGSAVSAASSATSANVTFTGATGIASLAAADFTADNSAAIGTVAISAGTVTITVNFAANASTSPKTYTVGIAGSSTKIKGSTTVVITQAGVANLGYSKVFGPVNFDGIADGAYDGGVYWTNVNGNLQNTSGLNPSVASDPLDTGNKVLSFSTGGDASQARATQLNFTAASDSASGPVGSRHKIIFDWYPGPVIRVEGISIQDGIGYLGTQDAVDSHTLDNIFITLYATRVGSTDYRLGYRTGNMRAYAEAEKSQGSSNTPLNWVQIRQENANTFLTKWYNVEVIVDFNSELIELIIIDKATGSVFFEKDDIPFYQGIAYNHKIHSIRIAGNRTDNSLNMVTYIDNVELYREDSVSTVLGMPNPVTDLTAAIGNAGAVLSWSKPRLASDYKVYYAKDTSSYGTASADQKATAITLSGLDNGVLYKAKVVAYNNTGTATGENEVKFTPLGEPDAVTDLACIDASNGQAILSWSAALRATGYKIFFASNTGAYPSLPNADQAGTGITLTGLVNGTAYKAKVVAYNADGDAAASNEITFTVVGLAYHRVFPEINFETIPIGSFAGGDYWTTRGGTVGATGAMSQSVVANTLPGGNSSDRALMFDVNNQGGSRGTQISFIKASDSLTTDDSRHGIAFDWYPGLPNDINYGYLGIQDGVQTAHAGQSVSLNNQYIAFYVTSSGELRYRVGNVAAGSEVSAGFDSATTIAEITNVQNWYRFIVIMNTNAGSGSMSINLTIIDLTTDLVVFELNDYRFDPEPGVTYNPRIASMRFLAYRAVNNVTWATYIDNLELFRYGDLATTGSININLSVISEQNITVSGWVASFSKSQSTVDITVGNFASAKWYLDGAEVPFTGKTYALDLTPLRTGTHKLTVVVEQNGVEYSKKLDFTVTN